MSELKQQFLESENRRLIQEKQNLFSNLQINKQLLNAVLSEQKFDEGFLIQSLQEESGILTQQIEELMQERNNWNTKNLILEQINLDLSQKSIQLAHQFSDKEFELNEKLQTATFLSDMHKKYFDELALLFRQTEGYFVNQKTKEQFIQKYNAIIQAKVRAEQPQNGKFQLNSVIFERDNLQMELEDALQQIDRLEQINRT